MNERGQFELWSLPWHDLQRRVALGLATAVNLQSVAASANSWLSRAARHAAPPAASPANSLRSARRRSVPVA